MHRAFPGSEYYGDSAPPRADRSTMNPARSSTMDSWKRARPKVVPVFTVVRLIEEEPDSAPAVSPRLRRRLLARPSEPSASPPGSSPAATTTAVGTHHSRPASTRFEPVKRWEALRHRFLTCSFRSRSPDPHHLAVLARPGFVRAAPSLPGTSRISLPSAPAGPLRRPDGGGLSPPLKPQRLTAHEARDQRLRHHLRWPLAGSRDLL